MNLLRVLGTNFDRLEFDPSTYSEEHRTWLAEEGVRPDWAIVIKDGSLSFLLDEDRKVKTIFVTGKDKIEEMLGVAPTGGLGRVTAKFGEPSTEGKEQNVPILGRKGAWVKYETADHVLHVESAVGSGEICMVTLMAPDAGHNIAMNPDALRRVSQR